MRWNRSWTAALLGLAALSSSAFAAEKDSKKDTEATPPLFFLQDPSDSLCLAGEEFKRCSIETLFYVVGTPGKYQIHKRAESGVFDKEDDGMCISKKSCKDGDVQKTMEVKMAKCSHCGAKNWNVLGDSDTGYVLTEGEGKTCLIREKGTKKAMTVPCDSPDTPFTPLQLQFATQSDIKTMSSDGARLVGAASDGDKKAVQALIKSGVDINVKDWDDLTALIPAASSGFLDLCKYLVKEGIDVNAKDKDGITALMEASIMGHPKVVDFLLSNGAEVDAKASSDVTALWLAASEGKVDSMKMLLKRDADANNARSDGITALMTASVGGHSEAVKLLLENGADPKATDGDGVTPLINAAENGTVAVLKVIAEHVDDPSYLDTLSNTGFNALIIASANGNTEAVKYLLSAGADVAKVHDNGVTALMYAAASNHVEVMEVLMGEGKAEVDFKHSNGGTALLEAATGGAVDAINLLLDKGAVLDFVDDDGVTPLMAVASHGSFEGQKTILEKLKEKLSEADLKEHINKFSYSGGSTVMFAAAGGHVNCTKHLVGLGADVKAVAKATPEYLEKLNKMIEEGTFDNDEPHIDGVTAMHVAAQGGHLECVEILLEAGAEVGIKDEEDRTPLLLAIKGNYGEVASVLVKNGADPNMPYVDDDGDEHNLLFDAIMVENEDFAKLLIENGADLYHKDAKKVTTLLQASHRGMADVVKMLLDKHASSGKDGFVDDASDEGITPLIAASSEGHDDVAKLLLDAKADVNAKDEDGTTALMAASARGHLEVVKVLLEAKPDVNVQNTDGHTALMFAFNGKNQVETLMERYKLFVKDAADEKDKKEADDDSIDDGGTGPIIREALGNHTALVDLLLKNGADETLKDKEGHTAKDFDFNPDTDSEVIDKEAKAEKVRDESKYEL